MKKLTIWIAGSTENTVACAEKLAVDERFSISGVLTPTPKLIGRKQILTTNPLHKFAIDHTIPVIQIEKRIDQAVKHEIEKNVAPDFLVVVDFGYIIPNWLLAWPQIAPVNIHPSKLPRWRGSSPGQFVLLYGELQSAVSVITMNEFLDQGDLIAQLPLAVQPDWTQKDYYQTAFAVVSAQLPDILTEFATGQLTAQPQPVETPTPIAGRFSKEDGFVPWELVTRALQPDGDVPTNSEPELLDYPLSPILSAALVFHRSAAKLIHHACLALFPWPGVWTVVSTTKGEMRMKILRTQLHEHQHGQYTLLLKTVQLEGKEPTAWEVVRTSIQT